MNREIAQRAVDFLRKDPLRFDMRFGVTKVTRAVTYIEAVKFFSATDYQREGVGSPACGTVCCFAGAVVLSDPDLNMWESIEKSSGQIPWTLIQDEATYQLGLIFAKHIFNWQRWPEPFNYQYMATKDRKERVEILVNYLNNLLEAEGQLPLDTPTTIENEELVFVGEE